jgi:hypothetical protein
MLWVYAFAAGCFVYNAAYFFHCIGTRQTSAAVSAALLFAVSFAVLTMV